jgi:hypothetical protein
MLGKFAIDARLGKGLTLMFRAALNRWLREPLVTGGYALLFAGLAVGVPTAVRAAVSGVVTGCEFTPFLPFVLFCAILLRWWLAGAVAVSAVAITGGLFTSSQHFTLPCFISSAAIFLGSSAIMIGVAFLIRHALASMKSRGADESMGGVVFSLEQGEVWASWYGQGPPVLLGSQRKVSEMMQDFLAQEELGKRLTERMSVSS